MSLKGRDLLPCVHHTRWPDTGLDAGKAEIRMTRVFPLKSFQSNEDTKKRAENYKWWRSYATMTASFSSQRYWGHVDKA